MLKLFYRTGGTANFKWVAALVGPADFAATALKLRKAGYPSVIALAAPTAFVVPGMMLGNTTL